MAPIAAPTTSHHAGSHPAARGSTDPSESAIVPIDTSSSRRPAKRARTKTKHREPFTFFAYDIDWADEGPEGPCDGADVSWLVGYMDMASEHKITARWEKPQRPRDSHAADAATPPAEVAADDPSLEEMLAAVLEASSNRTAKINKLWLRIMSQIVLIVYPLPTPSTLHYHTCFERARLTSRMMMRRIPTRLENRERRQKEPTTKATSMLIQMRRIRTRTVQKGSCMTLERRRLQFNCLSCLSLLNIASCLF